MDLRVAQDSNPLPSPPQLWLMVESLWDVDLMESSMSISSPARTNNTRGYVAVLEGKKWDFLIFDFSLFPFFPLSFLFFLFSVLLRAWEATVSDLGLEAEKFFVFVSVTAAKMTGCIYLGTGRRTRQIQGIGAEYSFHLSDVGLVWARIGTKNHPVDSEHWTSMSIFLRELMIPTVSSRVR